jgi:hypothetical protein
MCVSSSGVATFVSEANMREPVIAAGVVTLMFAIGCSRDQQTHPDANDMSDGEVAPGCTLEVTTGGESGAQMIYSGAARGTASLSSSGALSVDCMYATADRTIETGLNIASANAPGTYSVRGLDYWDGPCGNGHVTGCSPSFVADNEDGDGLPCTFVIEQIEPKARGGMRASIVCPSLLSWSGATNQTGTASLRASILLPPPLRPAPYLPTTLDPNDVCNVTVTGVYAGTGTGFGNVNGCSVTTDNALTFSLPFPYLGALDSDLVVSGDTWCHGCGLGFSTRTPGACTSTVSVDSIGVRFVGDFSCSLLTAIDGTSLSAHGHIDGSNPLPD